MKDLTKKYSKKAINHSIRQAAKRALKQYAQTNHAAVELENAWMEAFSNFNHNGALEIARFPRYLWKHISLQFICDYERAGGKYDSFGVWGLSPESFARAFEMGLDPVLLAEGLKRFGRCDFPNCNILKYAEFTALGYKIKSRKGLECLLEGEHRKMLMHDLGIDFTRCFWSAFKIKDFGKLLAQNAKRFPKEVKNRRYAEVLFWREERHEGNGIYLKILADFRKYQDRQYTKRGLYVATPSFASEKALVFHLRTGKMKDYNLPHTPHTSLGHVYEVNGCLHRSASFRYRFNTERNDPYLSAPIHTKNGTSFAQLGGIFFVWKAADGFTRHIESTVSLRDAFTKLEKRTAKESGILSLNDVRNDRVGTAGFCISGVKAFAERRMPFLHRQLKPYSNWNDVPSDVMETPYEPLQSVYVGFPNPTRV